MGRIETVIVVVVVALFLVTDAFQYAQIERKVGYSGVRNVLTMDGEVVERSVPSTVTDRTRTKLKKSLAAFSAYVACISTVTQPSVAQPLKLPSCSDEITILKSRDGRDIVLIGTAHISEESVDLVRKVIDDLRPDTVMVSAGILERDAARSNYV